MNQFQKNQSIERQGLLHPIKLIDLVMRAIVPGKNERFALDKDAERKIETEINALLTSDSMLEAVYELCLFASWLDKEHASPTACRTLLELAYVTIPTLKAIGPQGHQIADVLCHNETNHFRNFTGWTPEIKKQNSETHSSEAVVQSGPMARFMVQAKS